MLTEAEEDLLKNIPDELWSKGPTDVGLVKGALPSKLDLRQNTDPV